MSASRLTSGSGLRLGVVMGFFGDGAGAGAGGETGTAISLNGFGMTTGIGFSSFLSGGMVPLIGLNVSTPLPLRDGFSPAVNIPARFNSHDGDSFCSSVLLLSKLHRRTARSVV